MKPLAYELLNEPATPAPPRQLDLTWGCPDRRGTLVTATFLAAPGFVGDLIPCPTAAGEGECGTRATWRVTRAGVQRVRGVIVYSARDVDGDGRAESVTAGPGNRRTVQFDAGRHPVELGIRGALWPWRGAYVLLDLDGSPTRGFVRATAVAHRVTPRGLIAAPDVLADLWLTTVAARCPVQNVILPVPADLSPVRAVEPPEKCPGPSAAERAAAAAQIRDAVGVRARERGVLVTDGPPLVQWACGGHDLAAVVTYCEGLEPQACLNEQGTWNFEVWFGGALPLRRIHRFASGSVFLEWAVNSSARFVGSVDVIGRGSPAPILELYAHEGGADTDEVTLSVLVDGRLVPLLADTVRRGTELTVAAARGRGGDTVVVTSIGPDDDSPAGRHTTVRAFRYTGRAFRPLPAAAARVAAARAVPAIAPTASQHERP